MIFYVIIGGFCFIIETSFFYFSYLRIGVLAAHILSIFVAGTFSFVLNTFLNFKKTDRILRRLVKFSIATAIGISISTSILTLLLPFLGPIYSKFLSIPFAVIVQFAIKKIWVYKTYRNHIYENR